MHPFYEGARVTVKADDRVGSVKSYRHEGDTLLVTVKFGGEDVDVEFDARDLTVGEPLTEQDKADIATMSDEGAPDAQPQRDIASTLLVPTHSESKLGGGFRETWLQGNADDGSVVFRLDSGAGLGNSHLSLLVEDGEGNRIAHEYIDVTTLAEQWVSSILDAYAAAAQADSGIAAMVDALNANPSVEDTARDVKREQDDLDDLALYEFGDDEAKS